MKQGMYTQYAENLLKSVSDMVNSPRYDVTLAKTSIVSLMPHIQTEGKVSETKIVMLFPFCINKNYVQYTTLHLCKTKYFSNKMTSYLAAYCDISLWV